MAQPQQIKGEPYGFKADVWALGITAIELTEGKPPHSELTSMRAMIVIPRQPPMKLKGRTNPFTKQPHSDVFADFVDRCLQHAEEDRATVEELLQHEFITMHCKIENDRIVSKSTLPTLIAERYKCSLVDVVVDGDDAQGRQTTMSVVLSSWHLQSNIFLIQISVRWFTKMGLS